jgi:hypothetical protein
VALLWATETALFLLAALWRSCAGASATLERPAAGGGVPAAAAASPVGGDDWVEALSRHNISPHARATRVSVYVGGSRGADAFTDRLINPNSLGDGLGRLRQERQEARYIRSLEQMLHATRQIRAAAHGGREERRGGRRGAQDDFFLEGGLGDTGPLRIASARAPGR